MCFSYTKIILYCTFARWFEYLSNIYKVQSHLQVIKIAKLKNLYSLFPQNLVRTNALKKVDHYYKVKLTYPVALQVTHLDL